MSGTPKRCAALVYGTIFVVKLVYGVQCKVYGVGVRCTMYGVKKINT